MTNLLFHAPAWLLILLALAGIAVTYTGLQRQQPQRRNIGLGLLGLVALLLVLRLTIVTDEQRVEKNARALIQSINDKDWPAATRYLRHAQLYDLSGEEVGRRAAELSTHYGLTGVTINSVETRRDPNVITAVVSVTSNHKQMLLDSVPSTWNFEYQKRQEGWVLTNLVPIKIGGGYAGKPEDIIRMK